MLTATARVRLITSSILLAGVSIGCTEERRPGFHVQPDPELGTTSFVSAAGPAGSFTGPTASPPTDDRTGAEGGDVTIEEGDIYRALGDGKVLNLNAYRGLQVIDVGDPAAPAIIGSLRMSGSPVELYVDGDRALVLMNDWYGYWGTRTASVYGKEQGGAVLLVDLSDPTTPVILDRAVVPGYIQRSRLAKGARTNLYVAASLWQLYDDGATTVAVGSGNRTVVKGIELVGNTLVERKEVDLGGWVSDIAATSRALLVARTDWSESGASSQVAVVDISAEDGGITVGADITVAGQVKSQFNLDLRGDILRVVSEGGWSSGAETRTNHLETFDLADLAHPQPVDHETFGAGESLYATLFVGDDKAFFVTYLRQDPFHAFSIDAEGQATERSQYIVSGWNDFFRATFDDTRLVGVGIDDADGARKLALSLYDITDLTAAEPLVSRASVALDSAWSEASWDHRAFSVLEDAVSIPAAGGGMPATLETGLVLLPYSGWTADGYVSGVQLFTFSPTTLTARGKLEHPMAVRRAFLVEQDTAACLSDVALSTHDVSDPNDPTTLGTIDLAPSYPGLDIYGDYGLREVDTGARNYWGTTHEPPRGRADVIPLTGDPDRAAAITSFELSPGAGLTQVGELAVAMSAAWQADPADASKYAWETTVEVWDLTTATAPVRRGELVTSALPFAYGGWYAQGDTPRPAAMPDCLGCGLSRMAPGGTVVGDAIVFVEGISESAAAGTQEICVTVPPGETGEVVDPSEPGVPGARGTDARGEGIYYSGRIECVREGTGPESCYGAIYACSGLEVECTMVADPESIGAETTCKEQSVNRYWTRYVLHVLDVSNPLQPTVRDPIELPVAEEGVGLLAAGETLWVSSREPYDVPDDVRAYVKYYIRPIGFASPATPSLGARINVPGVLVAIAGDDAYTIDSVYDVDHIESALSRCTLDEGVATLVGRHRFADRQLQTVVLDGAGHVLVSHGPASWWYGYGIDTSRGTSEWETRLDVLKIDDLATLATMPIDTWAQLRWAASGKALFEVPGGLLVIDLTTPSAPRPQAWFATAGWPQELVVAARRIYVAGGLYGLYAFDLDGFNLLSPE